MSDTRRVARGETAAIPPLIPKVASKISGL